MIDPTLIRLSRYLAITNHKGMAEPVAELKHIDPLKKVTRREVLKKQIALGVVSYL